VRAFAGRCEQLVFCSSAIVYGMKMPTSVLIDENSPLDPTSHWGRSKVVCEQTFMRAAEQGAFKVTIARPGHTYGPASWLIAQDTERFSFLAEVSQFHALRTSAPVARHRNDDQTQS
jgi:nucleoside-diphosphate-sugar epimerase